MGARPRPVDPIDDDRAPWWGRGPSERWALIGFAAVFALVVLLGAVALTDTVSGPDGADVSDGASSRAGGGSDATATSAPGARSTPGDPATTLGATASTTEPGPTTTATTAPQPTTTSEPPPSDGWSTVGTDRGISVELPSAVTGSVTMVQTRLYGTVERAEYDVDLGGGGQLSVTAIRVGLGGASAEDFLGKVADQTRTELSGRLDRAPFMSVPGTGTVLPFVVAAPAGTVRVRAAYGNGQLVTVTAFVPAGSSLDPTAIFDRAAGSVRIDGA